MSTDNLPRIAVDQAPKMGHQYPFYGESDLAELIHDLYLMYPPELDSGKETQNTARFRYPLRISELQLPSVVGDLTWEQISLLWEAWNTDWESPLSGAVTRVAPIIVDADDEVVFDPIAENASYHVAPWGVDRLIVEWLTPTKILRLVITSASIADFIDGYVPESAILEPRTYTQINSGLRILTCDGVQVTQSFKMRAGHNMRIDVEPSPAIEGTRRRTRLTFNAIAGEGLGKTPGCVGEIDYLTNINDQLPDASGRIYLNADDCYRFQVPVAIADGLATVTPNALRLFSSCNPVCPPQYYVNVYRGISKLWDQWQDIADQLSESRDNYADSITRWVAQRECRRNNPVKMAVVREPNCRLAVSAVYCNAGKACLIPLELRFRFELLSGLPTAEPTQCGPALRQNSSLRIEEQVILSGDWPTWYTQFDYADPQSSSTLRFRICIPGCSGRSVKVTMTVHSPSTGQEEEAVIVSGPVNGSLYDTRALIEETVPLTASPPTGGGLCTC